MGRRDLLEGSNNYEHQLPGMDETGGHLRADLANRAAQDPVVYGMNTISKLLLTATAGLVLGTLGLFTIQHWNEITQEVRAAIQRLNN